MMTPRLNIHQVFIHSCSKSVAQNVVINWNFCCNYWMMFYIREQTKDAPVEETKDWNPTENVENHDPNESTESTEPPVEDEATKQLTLAEWKNMQEKTRTKSSFNIRKAGEGCDTSQWNEGTAYKKHAEENDDENNEDDEDEDDHRSKVVTEIRITFNDSPRRGRGSRRPRGGRGGRGERGMGRGERRGGGNSRESAPKFDDENDFPSLVKA